MGSHNRIYYLGPPEGLFTIGAFQNSTHSIYCATLVGVNESDEVLVTFGRQVFSERTN
jgi:hypothetical protein